MDAKLKALMLPEQMKLAAKGMRERAAELRKIADKIDRNADLLESEADA